MGTESGQPTPPVKELWNPNFLHSTSNPVDRFLIILNQPFSLALLNCLWISSPWRACADGGANRLYDILAHDEQRSLCGLLVPGHPGFRVSRM